MTLRNTLVQGFYDRIQVAVVAEVDPKEGFVTLLFTDQTSARDKVPIPVVAMSQDSWIRYIPQVNDLVVVGFRPDDSVVVLSWIPFQYKNRVEAFENKLSNAAGIEKMPEMAQQLAPGEIDMRSKGGGYIRLTNNGDVLIMSLAGQIFLQGKEGLNEFSQLGIKISDGKSHFRFGAPFRSYEQIDVREIPASGGGPPLAAPSPIRERDTRIYDKDGKNVLVQESLGTVVDEDGVLEPSGTTGGGALHQVKNIIKENLPIASTATSYTSSVPSPQQIAAPFSEIAVDHVKEVITQIANGVKSTVQGLITNIQTVYTSLGKLTQFDTIKDIVTSVQNIASDVSGLSKGMGELRGLGVIGKEVRYRLVVNKEGKQVAAYDIDEDGGIVSSSESDSGMAFNANTGGISMYAKKGLRLIAKGMAAVAETISHTAEKQLHIVAGTSIARTAGTDIVDSAENITLAAQQESVVGGGTLVRLNVVTTTIELNSSTVNVTTPGTVNVNAATVNVTGGAVTITGGTITLSGGAVTITGSPINIG